MLVSKKYQKLQFGVKWLLRWDKVYLVKAISRTLTVYEKHLN